MSIYLERIRFSWKQEVSTAAGNWSDLAIRLERKRVRTAMSKFEDTFSGRGDFAETGIFRCGLLMAFTNRENWTFRHINPASQYYIDQSVSGVIESAEQSGSPATYKLVAGSPYLAERIINSLDRKGRSVEDPNLYIEIAKGEDDLDCQEKQVLHLGGGNNIFVNLLRDQNVIKL